MSTRHSRQKRRDAGFTLVETLVALALLAAATAIVAPLFRVPPPATDFRRAVLGFAADLRLARAAAVKTNTAAVVDVDVSTGRYRADAAGASRALPAGTRLTLVAPPGEQTGPGSGRIRFRPDGSSSGGTLTLARDSLTARVDIDPFTGGIHVRW